MVFSLLQLIVDFFSLGLTVQFSFLLVIGFLEAANLEHVINNNANQSFVFIKFLFDPVFMKGSGITKRFALRLSGIFCSLALIGYFQLSLDQRISLGLFVLGTCLTLMIKPSSLLPDWLQENWVLSNVRGFFFLQKKPSRKLHLREDVELSSEKLQILDQKYKQMRPKEEGEKWLQQDKKVNVLLIVIEGLGETHLRKGWLPKLSQRKLNNLSINTFINHQRNTNRGIYSLYTGKHPNLVDQMAKPDLVAQYGKLDTGIAEVFNQAGYKTVYIQGAPLVFMCKDRFLPILGFQEVIGEEHYPDNVPRIKWGIDDHELYRETLAKIHRLESDKVPWFLSLLTVTTHHPVQASNKVLNGLEEGFRYVDEELDLFLNELERAGILESTLVCITSDEVTGDGQHVLSENLGTMVILTPDKIKKEVSTPFAQSDVAFSLCDYINIENHPFLGRSFFRTYPNERPHYFSSIFQQKSFLYQNGHLYISHYAGGKEILKLSELDLSCSPSTVTVNKNREFDQLQEFIQANDRGLDCLSSPIIMDLKSLTPTGEKVVKSSGSIKVGLKRGEAIKLRFQGGNQHLEVPLVVNWLIQDMKYKRSFKPNIVILPGQEDGFEKIFVSPKDSWYDLSLRVMANGNEDWLLHDLQISKVEN